MSEYAIEVSNATIRYGRVLAVDRVSLAVPRGTVYALLGRNGAGKSSLVRCLLGQRQPQTGTIRVFGEDVWTHRTALMQRLGVVSEEADAPPEMTVDQLARFCSELYARWDQKEVDDRLKRFDVSRDSRFGALSKGQKKQVLLALALAISPDLLILDDPTLGLDVVARKSLFDEVIAELADRGITVFLTTHDLAGIETLADRVAIMKNGVLVLEEDLDALKARFRRIRFAAKPVALQESTLRTALVRNWGAGSEAIVTNYDDVAFERLRSTNAEISTLSLEDIFIAVAGEGAQS
ncbi:MAG TPA: ABC transporter ATP-binding protein [Thermoanaerobaculia bacterium]|nr:ABC transporter ATP-binding protein [Thermoanaerobaculia bacterium]